MRTIVDESALAEFLERAHVGEARRAAAALDALAAAAHLAVVELETRSGGDGWRFLDRRPVRETR